MDMVSLCMYVLAYVRVCAREYVNIFEVVKIELRARLVLKSEEKH